MLRLTLIIALLLSQLDLALAKGGVLPKGGGGPPSLDIKGTCRQAQPVSDEQSAYDSCMNDEFAAQKELAKNWQTFGAQARSTCVQESQLGSSPSYVDLLTCLELVRDAAESARSNAGPLNIPASSQPANGQPATGQSPAGAAPPAPK